MKTNRFFYVLATRNDNPTEEKEFTFVDYSGENLKMPKTRKEALELFNSTKAAKEWTAFMVREVIEQMI